MAVPAVCPTPTPHVLLVFFFSSFVLSSLLLYPIVYLIGILKILQFNLNLSRKTQTSLSTLETPHFFFLCVCDTRFFPSNCATYEVFATIFDSRRRSYLALSIFLPRHVVASIDHLCLSLFCSSFSMFLFSNSILSLTPSSRVSIIPSVEGGTSAQ